MTGWLHSLEVFKQNDGEVTKAFYGEMNALGPMGQIAVALFRAQKRSSAAKQYRRGRFKHAAYDVKNWSISELCKLLTEHAGQCGIRWGWKQDPNTPGFEWVLYVDLPTGQASFHSAVRGTGLEYAGEWDGKHTSADAIIGFCEKVRSGG